MAISPYWQNLGHSQLLYFTTGGLGATAGQAFQGGQSTQATGSSASTASHTFQVTRNGVIKNLTLAAPSAVAGDSTAAISVNGVASALSATILTGQNIGQNLTTEIAVSRGDTIVLVVAGGSAAFSVRNTGTVEFLYR